MLARRAALLLLSGFALSVVGGAAAAQGASPITEQMETLFAIVLVLAILVGLVVYGTLAIALIRFRRSRSDGTPNPSTGNRRLETAWSVVPALILVGITIVSTQTLVFIETNPANALQIHVLGQQWSWEFIYPDNTTSSALYIQRGVTFLFNITSKDVIHSFYLPEFEIKKDAIKGVYNFLWFRADGAGRFHTQCAEYCGLGHSGMIAEVFVFNPEPGRAPYGPPPKAPPIPALKDVFLEEANGTPWRVVPANLSLTVNDYVELRVWNNGTATHNFTIDGPYNLATGPIDPGSFRALFLNATQLTTGTAYGGDATDRANGMIGTLVITGGRSVEVEIRESLGPFGMWSIFPSEIPVPVGEVVTFRIRNAGTFQHNFSIGPPFNVKHEPLINSGETVTLTAVFEQEARATYFCAVGGHFAAGMRGTLIVGNPQEVAGPVTYPFFDFALATFLIVGVAGFGYVIHHAVSGRRRGSSSRK